MLKTKMNQKGFAAVEAVLIVVILAIIGGTGYYVYHTNKKSNDTLNSASKIAQSSPEKISKKKPTNNSQATSEQTQKNAIIAAVKSYWTQKGKQVDSVTVTQILGNNAKGDFHLVGDNGGAGFVAHDSSDSSSGGSWQVVATGQQKPGKAIGAKYALPSGWYSTDY